MRTVSIIFGLVAAACALILLVVWGVEIWGDGDPVKFLVYIAAASCFCAVVSYCIYDANR